MLPWCIWRPKLGARSRKAYLHAISITNGNSTFNTNTSYFGHRISCQGKRRKPPLTSTRATRQVNITPSTFAQQDGIILAKAYQRGFTSGCSVLSHPRSEHATGVSLMMTHEGGHRAVVAFGSNLDDRVQNIEQALHLMKENGLQIISVSNLYETKAMYYENQGSFLNGACLVQTDLEPLELLDVLQKIENDLGRVRTIEKGPRTLDLDVILYNTVHLEHERLKIPHPLMLEREFVLRPLADILPWEELPESFVKSTRPDSPSSIGVALERVQDHQTPMHAITVLRSDMKFLKADDPQRTTEVMAIFNVTPDSFSDGGVFFANEGTENLKSYVRNFINAGATILDVGGQSTRPNATLLKPEEELERVIPVVRTIRGMPEASQVAISIDTFYSTVAERAIEEGADIINDVSAGLLDPQMLPTAARLGKTIILMHMRGNPNTMNGLCQYPNGVLQGVTEELTERVRVAKEAGILPWRMILDTGIGFAKNQEQNLQLLRDGQILRSYPAFQGKPWLVGISRKGFIGKITGVTNAADRQWGTAAGVTAAIAGGADIVRVHDVAEMVQVRTMADAIYRTV